MILTDAAAGINEERTQAEEGKGYAQACVKYFRDDFTAKKTEITTVFSDCRAAATKHWFPKYGFKEGMLFGYEL